MRDRPVSLRTVLASVTALMTGMAVLVAAALVLLTTYLHRVTVDLGSALERVRMAEEAQMDLLLHDRAAEPLVRREHESRLRRRLLEARELATPAETPVLEEAERRVQAYLQASPAAAGGGPEVVGLLGEAYAALAALANVDLAAARQARARAARWDYAANVLGITAGILLLLAAGALLWWLRARAFQPVLGLARAMDRFGRGDRAARAEVTGPAELRQMAERFNDMAAAIGSQRDALVAYLGGVAHDLRNPLAALRMAAEALTAGADPERALGVLHRQVERLDRMIGDFLDMARVEAGQLELKLELHDLRPLVEHVVDLFRGISPQHAVVSSLPSRPVPLRCDGLRVEQVVTNLISNAVKYSPGGGTVTVALEWHEREAELIVTDEGIGIAEQDQARLFEPFRRVGSSRETIPGVGLGLFMTRRIVQAHGGSIEVESALGRGSRFRVRLPLVPMPERAAVTAQRQPALR